MRRAGERRGQRLRWRLTVLILLGIGWVSGGGAKDWAPSAHAGEERRVCGAGAAPDGLPPPTPEHAWQNDPWPMEAHWYEPSRKTGLEVFTCDNTGWIAADGIGLRYTGPLAPPFAGELRKLLLDGPQRFNHVVLEIDSDGGDLAYVRELVLVLREVADRMELTTRVMEGSLCASGCIPVFMQGKARKASGASIWVFHGARTLFTNIPDPRATSQYLELLSEAGMDSSFRAFLEADNLIYRPGSLILSGYEVMHVHRAGIITELLPAWREERPVLPFGVVPR